MNAIPLVHSPNRRRRVRHKVRTPAYASFAIDSHDVTLDLNEVVDINEDGIAVQCQEALQPGSTIDLRLNLANARGDIRTRSRVAWSDSSGRAGLTFGELLADSRQHLREWLFLNAMSGADLEPETAANAWDESAARPDPNYSDTLAALNAIQRQVEALGSNSEAAIELIAARAHGLLRATGAAIALAESDPSVIICRASSGTGAPPVGARLHVDSGFSGECVRTGQLLRCDDTETDPRVNAEQCRLLGVRSLMAAPVRLNSTVIGLLEVFSSTANSFNKGDTNALQRLSEILISALERVQRQESRPQPEAIPVSAAPGSVLFAAESTKSSSAKEKTKERPAVSLPRSHLMVLVCAAATIALALGFLLAPWIQERLQARERAHTVTVLASTKAATTSAQPETPEVMSLSELQRVADAGNAVAQNELGVRYATGDGVKVDEHEAIQWFTKAAEQGNPTAQFRLGSFYWSGRGVPQNITQAYFWTVLARSAGDENSKALAQILASHLTRDQVRVIEQQANLWLQQRQASASASAR